MSVYFSLLWHRFRLPPFSSLVPDRVRRRCLEMLIVYSYELLEYTNMNQKRQLQPLRQNYEHPCEDDGLREDGGFKVFNFSPSEIDPNTAPAN